MVFLYFTAGYAIKTHDKIIEISGGASGIKDLGNLESPLEHIKMMIIIPILKIR